MAAVWGGVWGGVRRGYGGGIVRCMAVVSMAAVWRGVWRTHLQVDCPHGVPDLLHSLVGTPLLVKILVDVECLIPRAPTNSSIGEQSRGRCLRE
jgi:hypothetical protein